MDLATLENNFNKHLDNHRKDDKTRADADLKLYKKMTDLQVSIENLHITLREAFVPKDEISETKCEENFNKFMSKYHEKNLKKGNSVINFTKGIIWLITSIVSSVLIVGSGLIQNVIK